MNHNKIAIFLRGYQRTWNYTKYVLFETFEKIYGNENIDWYVAFWQTKTTYLENIKQDFNGKNLVVCELVDNSRYPLPSYMIDMTSSRDFYSYNSLPYYTKWKNYTASYWRPAYLDLILNLKKIRYEIENQFEYSQVLFIRPDIAYLCKDNAAENKMLDEFSIDGVEFSSSYHNEMSPNELYYKTANITSDIVSSRFLDSYTSFNKNQLVHPSVHVLFAWFLMRNGLREPMFSNSQIINLIIRPNMAMYVPSDTSKIDFTNEEVQKNTWDMLTHEQQLRYCDLCDIDPIEYEK